MSDCAQTLIALMNIVAIMVALYYAGKTLITIADWWMELSAEEQAEILKRITRVSLTFFIIVLFTDFFLNWFLTTYGP